MKSTIRRGFAGLAAAGLLGAGMMMGTGVASASGGHHNDFKKVEYCWAGHNGWHWGNHGYWYPCDDFKFVKYDRHDNWCKKW